MKTQSEIVKLYKKQKAEEERKAKKRAELEEIKQAKKEFRSWMELLKRHAKALVPIILMVILCSCTKENIRESFPEITKKRPTNENTQVSKRLTDPKVTAGGSYYNPEFSHWVQAIENPCDNETVNLDGWIGIKSRNAFTDENYFQAWFYSINNLTAIGSVSNANYKVAYREIETSTGSYINESSEHIVCVRWTLTSPTRSTLIYTFKEHFVSAEDGTITIYFTDTNYTWNCN